jgi:hypothetical protein
MNGTSIKNADGAERVISVNSTFVYDAHAGNTVFFHVKGFQTTPKFEVNVELVRARITEWPVEDDDEVIVVVESSVGEETTIMEETIYKVRKAQYGLDVLTLVITFSIVIYVTSDACFTKLGK